MILHTHTHPPQGRLLALPTCEVPEGLMRWRKVQDRGTFNRVTRAKVLLPGALWDTLLRVSPLR